MVGAPRFELGTSWSQTTRANQTALRPGTIYCTLFSPLRSKLASNRFTPGSVAPGAFRLRCRR